MLRVTEPYTLATTLVGFIKVLALGGCVQCFGKVWRCSDVTKGRKTYLEMVLTFV